MLAHTSARTVTAMVATTEERRGASIVVVVLHQQSKVNTQIVEG